MNQKLRQALDEASEDGLLKFLLCDFVYGTASGFYVAVPPRLCQPRPPMTDSPPSSLREERIREMLELEVEFLPRADYLKRLCFGGWEPHVRNQALDWILKQRADLNFFLADLGSDVNSRRSVVSPRRNCEPSLRQFGGILSTPAQKVPIKSSSSPNQRNSKEGDSADVAFSHPSSSTISSATFSAPRSSEDSISATPCLMVHGGAETFTEVK
ncbi:hypothetical protein Bca52824_026308 [Brassica carinata]|uniref:Uncharacterized protein n=1 Tax=Brassica carinata TaxID=52824 RepID=A0A8X7SHD3_BRACI|nr:hypothetical protein Bca52824_026308 [Brassica carinata]